MSRGVRIRARRGMLRRSLVAGLVAATAGALLGVYGMLSGLPAPGRAPASLPTPATTPSVEPPSQAAPLPRREVTLFFLDAALGRLSPETREIEAPAGAAQLAKNALDALVQGPKSEGHLALLPPETKILAVFLDAHGEAFVDFSADVSAPTGIEEELLGLASVALTLTRNFPEVTRLRILIEGRETPAFRGHLSVEYPLVATDPAFAALAGEEPTLPAPPAHRGPGPGD